MNKIETLGDFVESAMDRYADKVAFQCAGHRLTFTELERLSRHVAVWLQARFNSGDRIAIQLPNINQYPIIAMGILRAGMVVVNTNPLYTPREMKHQFKDSGAKALFILSPLLGALSQILDDTLLSDVVAVDPVDLIKEPEPQKDCYRLYDVLKSTPSGLLATRTGQTGNDIAMLQYTGGTTGAAKGACLTHLNLLSNIEQIRHRLSPVCTEGQELFVCPLPLYHIYAFTVNLLYLLGIGACNVLIPNPRDIDGFVNQLKEHSFTGMSGINTLFLGLMAHEQFRELDFSHLKMTISGGTTLVADVANLWTKVTGSSITEGYGLTETSPVALFNIPGQEEIGAIGVPVKDTEVAIRDGKGEPVKQGVAGELLVRGPQVMMGYWQNRQATANAFTHDGFFKTGDIALQQANGNYKIVDRLKDMILVSGFNVYPNEIEGVLSSHANVMETAVVGGPSVKTGEEVLAYVTTSGEVTSETLLAYCRENLTAYKVPKKITILDELPKSAVGKILRRELRNTV